MARITFEHLRNGHVPNGYEGMSWSLDFKNEQGLFGGYKTGLHSGHKIAFNGDANPVTFSSEGADFNFRKGFFTGAWSNDLTVTVTAYDDGHLVGTKVFTVDQDAPTRALFGHNFRSIDSVTIATSGGVDVDPDDDGTGMAVAMDDFFVRFEDAARAGAHHHHTAFDHLHGGHAMHDWMLAG